MVINMHKSLFLFILLTITSVNNTYAEVDIPLNETITIDVSPYNIDQKTYLRAVARAGLFSRWTIDSVNASTVILSRDYGKKGQSVLKARIDLKENSIIIDGVQNYWKQKPGKFNTLSKDVLSNIQQLSLGSLNMQSLPADVETIPQKAGLDGKEPDPKTVTTELSQNNSLRPVFHKIAVKALARTGWKISKVEADTVTAFRNIQEDTFAVKTSINNNIIETSFISTTQWSKEGWLKNINKYILYYAKWDAISPAISEGKFGVAENNKSIEVADPVNMKIDNLARSIFIKYDTNKVANTEMRKLIADTFNVLQWDILEAGSNYVISGYTREGIDKYKMRTSFQDGVIHLFLSEQHQKIRFNWIRSIRDRIIASISMHELGLN